MTFTDIRELSAIDAAMLAAEQHCPHCEVGVEIVSLSNGGLGVGVVHEPGCRNNRPQ